MLELLTKPESWAALATLTLLEIVLGIDNLVFIAILTGRLPRAERTLAYRLGLAGAMVTRILLLLGLSWVMHLNAALFSLLGRDISGRDLILLIGGVFLIGKSAHEIYEKVEIDDGEDDGERKKSHAGLWATIVQIWVMDIIFSLDSVVTAVGMVDEVPIMIIAIVIAVIIMVVFAGRIGDFINRHPSMKILALSFMLLIGVLLVAEGFGQHISKGYIYSAMGFALLVEVLNMRFRKKHPAPPKEQVVEARPSQPG
ncbi:MAG: TerC family protein [Sandaracinaceae bacterium]|nr:TerC family protein [Sandaracinaceae bacterium]